MRPTIQNTHTYYHTYCPQTPIPEDGGREEVEEMGAPQCVGKPNVANADEASLANPSMQHARLNDSI